MADEEDGLAEHAEHPPGGWNSHEDRQAALDKADKSKPSLERIEGLLQIHELAAEPSNREDLWKDEEVRAALLSGTTPPDPDAGEDKYAEDYKEPSPADDVVRVMAFGVMLFLLTSPVSCRMMVGDKAVRGRLIQGTAETETVDARVRSTLALGCLAVNGACAKAGRDLRQREQQKLCPECGQTSCIHLILRPVLPSCDTDVLEALLRGAAPGLPTALRAGVLGVLWSVAATGRANPAALWSVPSVRERLLACASGSEPFEVRATALGALWALAVDDENKEAFWNDQATRRVLLDATSRDQLTSSGLKPQPLDLRTKAFGAVANLAAASCNKEALWTADGFGKRALQAAEEAGPLRSDAVRALLHLAKHEANQEAMVEAGVPAALQLCSEDPRLNTRERTNCRVGRERLLVACPPVVTPETAPQQEEPAVSTRQKSKLMHQQSMSRMSSRAAPQSAQRR